MKTIGYKAWIAVALIVVALDALSNLYGFDEGTPPGTSSARAFIGFVGLCVGFLLAIPIVVPRVFAVHYLFVKTGIITYEEINRHLFWIIMCLGDLFVCFLYFMIFQVGCWIWKRRLLQK